MNVYSSSDSDDGSDNDGAPNQHGITNNSVVWHTDVDYFYAQCEEQQLPIHKRNQPIAVGQKHIIVTCNYVARAYYGISKLMLKTDAMKRCPHLLLLDGSDLQQYRQYSTQIYKVLRQSVLEVARECGVQDDKISLRKGGMDEVTCDVTALVDAILEQTIVKDGNDNETMSLPSNAFIYGDISSTSSPIVLTEDQSGAQSIVPLRTQHDEYDDESALYENNNNNNTAYIQQRLHVATACAERIRQAIFQQTNFTTSMGVSTSSMLAKIASSLQKPNGLSVLYPWRGSSLIASMPLRSIPQLGSKTLKVLQPCLERYNGGKRSNGPDSFWKCRDLLQVPRHEVLTCLQTMNLTKQSSESLCDELINKCRGMDDTRIKDDAGGLPKTVSVENSFRRYTVTTETAVWNSLQDLFWRLPRLLDDRQHNSEHPDRSYPTTIRLTAGMVDTRLLPTKKRPFVTKSKQCSLNGKALMAETSDAKKSEMIQQAVTPLVNSLILSDSDINVVRLNIAVTGFQDLSTESSSPQQASPWAAFTTKGGRKRQRTQLEIMGDSSANQTRKVEAVAGSIHTTRSNATSMAVDPAVLAELPADIQAEVCQMFNAKDATKRTIDQFFAKK